MRTETPAGKGSKGAEQKRPKSAAGPGARTKRRYPLPYAGESRGSNQVRIVPFFSLA